MSAFTIPNPMVEVINDLTPLADDCSPHTDLKLWENPSSGLSCYYAPFDYFNAEAKIILVGITPGRTQMNKSLNAARYALSVGIPIEDAIRKVKREGSFSGAMRKNIVNTLNRLGYQSRLGIECAGDLWSSQDHLVHFCSLLKYPVFLNGKDYNGTPKAHKDADLKKMLHEHFVVEMQKLPHSAMLVPLGDSVLEVIVALYENGQIPQSLMKFEGRYVAPPHPSGANAESIALLLKTSYPSEQEYADKMYQDYLARAPWKKKGGKAQSEVKYKAARTERWRSMLFVRRAYGLQ